MIYFISETYIKENTPLSQNIDVKDILPHIQPAQDLHIQDILGSNFYNYLWTAYSGQTLTANEETLVTKIKPALAYRAAEMALPFIQYQVKNKGIQTQFGDNSVGVGMSELSYLRNELKNRAEFYSVRVVEYLKENSSLFSGYTTNNTTDIDPDKSSPYNCGIVFYKGSGYNNGCNNDINTYGVY